MLDQLLWRNRVELPHVEHLLVAAAQHPAESVREQAEFIREYLRERAERAG